MKLFSVIFLLSMLLTSCVNIKNKNTESFNVLNSSNMQLKNECKKLNSVGELNSLLSIIHVNTDEVFEIINKNQYAEKLSRLEWLEKNISDKIKQVVLISDPIWTDEKWNYQFKWKISKDDFKGRLGNLTKTGVEIKKLKIVGATFMGERNSIYLPKIETTKNHESYEFLIENYGSTLLLCQLFKSMSILVKVEFLSLGKLQTQYFNLMPQYQFQNEGML